MRKTLIGALATLVFAGAFPLMAQDNGARPAPKILQIYRESVKPGHNAAHERTEVGWPKAFKAGKSSSAYLAMTTMTGPSEAWFMSGYPSYEAWENQRKADDANTMMSAELDRLSTADGEHLDKANSITAMFREDLSMRPALNIGDYRYMSVSIVRLRPGTVSKFVEMRKAIKAAHEKTGMKDYYSVFAVQSGMPGPTFLIFAPMKSLKEIDEAGPLHNAAAYKEAMGGDEGDKKMTEMAAASIINGENILFAFSPKMSVPPPEYSMGGNAEYWAPKAVMAAAPKAKTTASAKKP
jgi:hypothetical protein